jgi:Right handed beta helix region
VSIGGDAQKTKLTDVTAFGCQSDGFDLNDSDLGKVKGSFADGNGEKGFVLGGGATGNKIEKSAAVGNGGAGFEVSGTGNTLKNVDAASNNQGFNLLAPGNTISGCTAYHNANAGVFVNADDSRVSKCDA